MIFLFSVNRYWGCLTRGARFFSLHFSPYRCIHDFIQGPCLFLVPAISFVVTFAPGVNAYAFAAAEFREPINLIAAYHVRWKGAREAGTKAAALRPERTKILLLTLLITGYRSSTFLIEPSNRFARPKSKPVTFQAFSIYSVRSMDPLLRDRSTGIIVTELFLGKRLVCRNLPLIIGYIASNHLHSY